MFCNYGFSWGGWHFGGWFMPGLFILIIIAIIFWQMQKRPTVVAPHLSCPKCSGSVQASYFRCPHCGEALKHNCPNCSRIIEYDWQFCPYCNEHQTQQTSASGAPAK